MPLSRVLLLVTAAPAAQRPELSESFRLAAKQALKSARVEAGSSRVLFPISDSEANSDDYTRVLSDGLSNGVHLGGFDAVFELNAPDRASLPALVKAMEEFRATAGHLVASAKTAAVAGTDVVVVDGSGPVHLVYGMRRKADTSHEEFSRFWEKQHTAVARFTPGLAGYRQLHADPELSKAAAEAAGVGLHDVDGVAIEWFANLPDFCSAVGAPVDFKERAKSSEGQFNDIERATAIVVADI
jgi:hypothetical protein